MMKQQKENIICIMQGKSKRRKRSKMRGTIHSLIYKYNVKMCFTIGRGICFVFFLNLEALKKILFIYFQEN